jgi:microcin C transport system ATP-binding protein
MSLVEIDDLSIRFGTNEVVRGVGLHLARGETLALVGESGSGKSLTALSLLRLLPPGAECSGRVNLDGEDVLAAPEPVLRHLRGGVAGMVFQEPMTSLNPLMRVGRQVEEAILLHGLSSDLRMRSIALLEQCGFADAAKRCDSYPHQLSGGQRQRVMIAMALANDPALLIADEPTTALDVTIQAQILDLLAAQKKARGLAMLLISHDLNIVRRHADRVCVMRHGEIVEHGAVEDVFANPSHDYTRMLIAAEPSGRPQPIAAEAATLLEAEDIRVVFATSTGLLRRKAGEVRAVDGVSLTLRQGETLGVVGESGSGKSTLAAALLMLEACEGRIVFLGEDIASLPRSARRAMRARAQIVFQDPFGSLSPRMSVGEIVAEGLRVHARHLSDAEREAKVADVLREVGLEPENAARYPHEFSGGQRQRIAIARALVLEPRMIVLDEPTSALDRSVQAQIVDLLRRLQQERGLAYLFISHDLSVVRALAHRVMVMREGCVVEAGDAGRIFTAPTHPYTQALLKAAFGT